MMYNPQLDTFLRVAEAGSFSKAAEEMFITPPAVIKQINLLEDGLGVKLFTRTHRGLLLTEAGKSMYGDTKRIIQDCNEAVVRAKNAMQDSGNVVRIGTSPMTPGQFVLKLWPAIQEQCPDIKFQLVPFENSPQNARNILRSLGQNIDIVAGAFDQNFLQSRKCAGLELLQAPIRCAASIYHHLAEKNSLTVQDLYGEELMLIQRGWNQSMDILRDDLWQLHPSVNIVDFDFFSLEVYNQCENSSAVLTTIDPWAGIHPLLKVLPVDWDHKISFGLLHSPKPSPAVRRLLDAFQAVYQ
ncbi:LysR family transcriptional regulator [Pseudoflavonifractor sp. 60]|uniref:LysR family transcriptional regulator n=1 Tax=Pseudoflavonifractor sp. 60 TaxID=2304576 RepID=UPI00325A4CDD